MVDITKLFNGSANGNGKHDDFDVEKVLASLSTVCPRRYRHVWPLLTIRSPTDRKGSSAVWLGLLAYSWLP
jgi:hypothetical protein